MEAVRLVLTAVRVLAAIGWSGAMIFHIAVLDPVFRKNEVSVQSAFLLALMEQRFRKLVGMSIVMLAGSGFAKAYLLLGSFSGLWAPTARRYILLKIGLTGALLVLFSVCPET